MRQVSKLLCVGLLLAPTLVACSKNDKELAPAASALASAAPVNESSKKFALDASKSGITFTMDAELEKISGRAPASARGQLFVDLEDIEKSSGLIKVDLDELSIYKQNRDDAESEYGEEQKNEKQNRDMRMWFQISEDGPQEQREKFRWVQFKITKVSAATKDVAGLTGATRTVDAKVTGDLLLHGRKTEKTLALELTFDFDGETPKSLAIRSKEPFDVGLEEHDVRPRKAFDQLADRTLDALGAKVAKVAKVEVEVVARPK
jgi:polyisoprenoid-binding protein YceI